MDAKSMMRRAAMASLAPALMVVPSTSRDTSPKGIAEPVKPRGKVGRNDPCPCGSGKKRKRCNCPPV